MTMTVWIWTHLFLTFWTVVAGDKITCGVAERGQLNVAQLTCYFPEDIGLTKKNIQVNRLTDNNGESTTLLDCKWRDGRHLCFVKTGLSFDRNFSKSITIAIPASWTVDSDNVIYTCHIVSPGLYESVPCKFTPDQVAGHRTTCTVVKTNSANYTQLTCYYPEDVGLLKRNIQVNRLSGGNGESTNLVDCKWSSGKPLCFVKSGLIVERNFTKNIFIQIPASSFGDTENEIYSCSSSNPGLYQAVPCTLLQHPDKLTTESSITFMNDTEHVYRNNASFTGPPSGTLIQRPQCTNGLLKSKRFMRDKSLCPAAL